MTRRALTLFAAVLVLALAACGSFEVRESNGPAGDASLKVRTAPPWRIAPDARETTTHAGGPCGETDSTECQGGACRRP